MSYLKEPPTSYQCCKNPDENEVKNGAKKIKIHKSLLINRKHLSIIAKIAEGSNSIVYEGLLVLFFFKISSFF